MQNTTIKSLRISLLMLSISLYIHIPFCTTKCTYCAFNTYTNLEVLIPRFVSALAREVELVACSGVPAEVKTIFFGGGTPSLLSIGQFDQILEAVNRFYQVRADAEITLEANPNDLSLDYLVGLRRLGFNRISIGMQTAIASELVLFARRHNNDAVALAVSTARRAGFSSINLDLIYGVPHQTLDDWAVSLAAALALKPQHLSLYALGLEEGTPLKKWVERGQVAAPDDDAAADMYELATDRLAQAGYEQYEISNWAQPGFESQHNLQYWLNLPYIGLGPGAHGFAGGVRYSTVLSPRQYIQAIERTQEPLDFPLSPAVAEFNQVDTDTEIAETLIMGLRLTRQGIDRGVFRQRFGIDVIDRHRSVIEKYAAAGLLEYDEVRLRLTRAGRMLSNAIFRELV